MTKLIKDITNEIDTSEEDMLDEVEWCIYEYAFSREYHFYVVPVEYIAAFAVDATVLCRVGNDLVDQQGRTIRKLYKDGTYQVTSGEFVNPYPHLIADCA